MRTGFFRGTVCIFTFLLLLNTEKVYPEDYTFTIIPDLTGVDGYIYKLAENDSRLYIHFGQDGIPGDGGMCCSETLKEARNNYPDKNLVYLPEATKDQVQSGQIPDFKGVDGYIRKVSESDNRFKITFAVDGEPSGGGFCCREGLENTRRAYPQKNLVYLGKQPAQSSVSSVPDLTGVDGYIYKLSENDSRLYIRFAENGVPGSGGMCCSDNLEEARRNYPDKNLIYLPEATKDQVKTGQIPELYGVDGFIRTVSDNDDRLKITFAEDGEPSGGGYCCSETVDEARKAYPDKNLAYIGEKPVEETEFSPDLTGIDGYITRISDSDRRFKLTFARDGEPGSGGYCCQETVQEVRRAYPDKNLVYLPAVTSEDIREYLNQNVENSDDDNPEYLRKGRKRTLRRMN